MKTPHLSRRFCSTAILLFTVFGCISLAQAGGMITPYSSDEHTVLLDHFDGATTANILAFTNNGAPCGAPRPPAAANYAFTSAPAGLDQALALYAPLGTPAGSSTYLNFPGGELLSQPNGTMECWIYLNYYAFSIHQFHYVGECEGNVGGMYVNEFGQLEATIWDTVFTSFNFNSGSTTIPLNTWTHIALTWGSTGAKLYVNGTLVGSHPNTGSFASWFGLGSVFAFTGQGNFIDELRISSVQRTTFNLLAPSAPPTVELKMFAGLIISGDSGSNYEIQASPALGPTNWMTLTNFVLSESPFTFIDYRSPTNSRQFYRVLPVD